MHINLLTLSIIPQFLRFGEGKSAKNPNVAQHTLYDIRGADGTGTSANPVPYNSPNAKSYTVRKLADGNCWMTENLALPLASGTTIEAAYSTSATPFSYTPTSCSTNGSCAMNSNTVYNSTYNVYYYTWYAAVAGTGDGLGSGDEATGSLCPVGWRIPANYTVDRDKSFGSITNAYGITTNAEDVVTNSSNPVILQSIPISFVRTGVYHDGSSDYTDLMFAYDWSSTSKDSTTAWDLHFRTARGGDTFAQHSNLKYWGIPVRCVAL